MSINNGIKNMDAKKLKKRDMYMAFKQIYFQDTNR